MTFAFLSCISSYHINPSKCPGVLHFKKIGLYLSLKGSKAITGQSAFANLCISLFVIKYFADHEIII